MNSRLLAPLIALAFAGNGFAQDHRGAAAPHDQHDKHGSHGSHESHHPTANEPLMAFHELMEPLWHAAPGKETNARACKLAGEIIVRAKAAATRPSPDHAALIQSAETLKRNCGDGGDPAITVTLDQLHGAFHRLSRM